MSCSEQGGEPSPVPSTHLAAMDGYGYFYDPAGQLIWAVSEEDAVVVDREEGTILRSRGGREELYQATFTKSGLIATLAFDDFSGEYSYDKDGHLIDVSVNRGDKSSHVTYTWKDDNLTHVTYDTGDCTHRISFTYINRDNVICQPLYAGFVGTGLIAPLYYGGLYGKGSARFPGSSLFEWVENGQVEVYTYSYYYTVNDRGLVEKETTYYSTEEMPFEINRYYYDNDTHKPTAKPARRPAPWQEEI